MMAAALAWFAGTIRPHAVCAGESVDAIVNALIDEAQTIRRDKQMAPPADPDFAERWAEQSDQADDVASDGRVDRAALGERLSRSAHDDPFIDAYVRWQLTSFEPQWPQLDAEQWRDALRAGPWLLDNPSAEPRLIAMFERAAAAGALSRRDFDRLKTLDRDRRGATERIDQLNRPAEQFREWVADEVEGDWFRTVSWRLAQCSAVVEAGWSTRSVKTRITRACRAAGAAGEMARGARAQVRGWLESMAGMERRFINEVTFLASGEVNVRFSTASVRTRDAERWLDLLRGESP